MAVRYRVHKLGHKEHAVTDSLKTEALAGSSPATA